MKSSKDAEKFAFKDAFGEKACENETALFRYFEGKLSADEEKSFEEHIRKCFRCAKQLGYLLKDEERIREAGADPKRMQKELEKHRTMLRAALDVKFPGKDSVPVNLPAAASRQSGWGPWNSRAFANAFLILAIAVLAYPAYRSFVLEREIQNVTTELEAEKIQRQEADRRLSAEKAVPLPRPEPMLSPSAVYSARPQRDEKTRTIVVDFDTNPAFNLVFALPPSAPATCSVEILKDAKSIWRKETQVSGTAPLISVVLHAEAFQAGDYLLRITKQGTPWLVEYKLTISN